MKTAANRRTGIWAMQGSGYYRTYFGSGCKFESFMLDIYLRMRGCTGIKQRYDSAFVARTFQAHCQSGFLYVSTKEYSNSRTGIHFGSGSGPS